MKKILFFISALMMIFACGNKTAQGGDSDSTAVPDTLNTKEAVVKHVHTILSMLDFWMELNTIDRPLHVTHGLMRTCV